MRVAAPTPWMSPFEGRNQNSVALLTPQHHTLQAKITYLNHFSRQRHPRPRPVYPVYWGSRIRSAYGNGTSRANSESDDSPNGNSYERTILAPTTPPSQIRRRTSLRPKILVALLIGTVITPIVFPQKTLAGSYGDIVCPLRDDWNDEPKECPCKDWTPTAEQVEAMVAKHSKWATSSPIPDFNAPGRAIFCNSTLPMTNFSGKLLARADFRNADLTEMNLRQQNRGDHFLLLGIDYTGADLRGADFSGARISAGIFHDTNVSNANFDGAHLMFADFSKSTMDKTKLAGATFEYVNLSEAKFAPLSLPKVSNLGSITGLMDVRFPKGKPASLVELQTIFRKSGLRQREREVTYAIHSTRTDHLLESCPPDKWLKRQNRSYEKQCSPKNWMHGALQIALFEWTTGWGLHPFRAIWIMIVIAGCLTPLYVCCVWARCRCCSQASGVFRVWPRERFDVGKEGTPEGEEFRVERISVQLPYAVVWGIYFAILSAFHIGWRDINIASLIRKLQFREDVLRGYGWIRSVAGAQSLISVFLFALWILTYFGRPFKY